MQNCGEEWMRNDRHSHPGRVGGGGGGVLSRNFGGGVPLVLQKPDPVLN